MTSIKIGDSLPSFSLPDKNGILQSIDEIRKGRNLVLYFYPKDETLVCTKQACGFRNDYAEFERNNCEIVGISSDPPESHRQFIDHHHLPFILLSDVNNEVRTLLGVPRDLLGLISGRYTYVINKKGIIIHIFNDYLFASKHITESLKALENEQGDH